MAFIKFAKDQAHFTVRLLCIAAVVAMMVWFSTWATEANAADAEVQAQIDEAIRAASRGPFEAADGVWEGSAEGYGGLVTVAVTIDNGYIDSVEIVDASHEDEAWLEMAVTLLDTIPAEQSTNVDVVTSATYTSCGIINGCKDALLNADKA